MNILNFALVLSLSFSNSYVHAAVIALGDPDKIEDFKDHLEAHPEDQSLKKTLLTKTVQKSNELIESKYSLAVKGLIMSDLKPSIYLFKEISSYPQNGLIFSDPKLELLYESFYRLSNLDRSNAQYWIKKGILNSPEYLPSEDTFNPSIIAKHKKTLKDLDPYLYKLSTLDFSPKWSTTYINGKLQEGVFKVYPHANYVVKVFKEGHYPYENTFLGENLIKMSSVDLKKINFGSCKNPLFKSVMKQKIDKIFFNKNCILSKKEVKNRLVENQKINIYPSSQNLVSNDRTLQKTYDADSNKKKPSIFTKRKTWLYVIGAVALTSLALSISSADNSPARIKPVQHD